MFTTVLRIFFYSINLHMKAKKRRFAAFLTGVIICLLLLECSLRVVGVVYAKLSEIDSSDKGPNSTTILCIGDSFTFGIGASMALSYPNQLETLLNQDRGNHKIAVINRGWPGQNSSQIYTRLENYLDEFHPDIVTILVGGQNLVNYYGYQDYLKNANKQGINLLVSLNNFLDHIRIYKFGRLLFEDSSRSSWTGDEYANENKPARVADETVKEEHGVIECVTGLEEKEKGNYDKALELILPAAKTKNIGAECANIVGSIYKDRKEYDNALIWFEKGISYNPAQFKNYEDIGQTYYDQKKFKEAVIWYKKGFTNASYETLHPRCYTGISRAFTALNDTEDALAFFEQETKRQTGEDDFLRNLAADCLSLFKESRKNEAVYSWLESDLVKIIKLCKRYKARPILQTYPFMPEINFIYQNVAKEYQISLVDHQKAFEDYTRDDVLDPDYFIPDGHPNSNGYHLMAETIKKTLDKDFNLATE